MAGTLRTTTSPYKGAGTTKPPRPPAETHARRTHRRTPNGSDYPTMTLALLGVLVLFAQEVSPSSDDIWRLGGFAVALLLGAAVTYRYTTLPERERSKAEVAERIAAQEREREAYQVTTPALTQITNTLPDILAALRQRREL